MQRIAHSTHRVNGHVAASTEQWRPAPYNLEAEQALLGAILLKNEVYDRVSPFLPATDFYDPLHQQIYATAGQLITAGAAATPITLRTFFENAEPIDANCSVPQYLGRLAANVPTTMHAQDYARTIHDLAARRHLMLIGEDVVAAAADVSATFSPAEQIAEAADRLQALRSVVDVGEWPEPEASLLDDSRGSLPDWPAGVFDEPTTNWLERAARGAGTRLSFVAIPLLTVASILIGAGRYVRASTSWAEPMAVWTAVVAVSGGGKSPGQDVVMRALELLERARHNNVEEQRRAHARQAEIARAEAKRYRAQVQDALQSGSGAGVPEKPRSAEIPAPFVAPRFFVTDPTTERLAMLVEARPRGVAVIADELAAVFKNMNRYSRGGDAEFYLAAWNGRPYVVERMGRPPVDVQRLLIGVTGGLQPDVAAEVFGAADNGLYARFLFGWPEPSGYQPLADVIADVDPRFQEALERLATLPAGDDNTLVPSELALSGDALDRFERFRADIVNRQQGCVGRDREWLAKGPTQVLRLAGTMTFLSWAMGGGVGAGASGAGWAALQHVAVAALEPTVITDHQMERAIRLYLEFFWPHARAVLNRAGRRHDEQELRRCLLWLRSNASATTPVSRDDLHRHALAQRHSAQAAQRIADQLEQLGWLRSVADAKPGAGRKRRTWMVNPALWQKA